MAIANPRIEIDTGSKEPLYRQIVRQVRALVTAGRLVDGDALPSIRGLARQLEVSVITVQRAYEEIQREGLARTLRGRGLCVTKPVPSDVEGRAEKRLEEGLQPLLKDAMSSGLSSTAVRTTVQRLMAELRGK